MAHLPPKIPTNWPNFPSQRTPSMNSFFPTIQSSWVEDFPDFSSVKRSSHCRSASDSVTFLEAPEECGTFASKSTRDFDKIDGEQLMSMFSDDITGALPSVPLQRASPNSSENPSTPSYRDSINDLSTGAAAADNNNDNIIYDSINTDNNNKDNKSALRQTQLAGEAEVQSAFNSETQITTTTTGSSTVSADSNIDPKRVKRILANRQSAQRSRVRKLQYISELERSVTSLQTEVSTLSPQVAFLDHQRLVLNVDNSTLKQRIAALAQDKLFKDAHQEALKQEIERLRQLYYQQNLHKITGTPREP